MTHILGCWALEFTLELIRESNNLICDSLPQALADDNSIWCSVHREERTRCEHFSHVCVTRVLVFHSFLSLLTFPHPPFLHLCLIASFLSLSVPVFLIVDASCFRASAAAAVVPRLRSVQPRVPLSFLPLSAASTQ